MSPRQETGLTARQKNTEDMPKDTAYINLCYTFGFMAAVIRGEIPENEYGKLIARKNIEQWLESRPICLDMDIARIVNLAKSVVRELEKVGVTDESIRPLRKLWEGRVGGGETDSGGGASERQQKKAAW